MPPQPTPRRLGARERGVLAAAAIFQDLAPGEVESILDAASLVALGRREILFRQGDAAPGLYVAVEGRFKLTQLGADGREVVIRLLAPGDVFAAVAALQRAPILPVTAAALTDGTVALWPRDALPPLLEAVPRLATNVFREVAERAQEFQSRLREVATQRVPQRVAAMLLRLAHQAGRPEKDGVRIDFPLTREDLAEMTGTTLFSVSRLLTEWAAAGLVRSGRSRVVLRDLRGLQAVADDPND